MSSFQHNLDNLNVCYVRDPRYQSTDNLRQTSFFQIFSTNSTPIQIYSSSTSSYYFEAVYIHQGKKCKHPFDLVVNETSQPQRFHNVEPQPVLRKFEIFLRLKRLRNFSQTDTENYLAVIDQSLDVEADLHDFHKFLLILNYKINGQEGSYECNQGQVLHLPRFEGNPWTFENTTTRFRYDAENRDGTFPLEMALKNISRYQLTELKIVLCSVSNTVPLKMDHHALRWICKVKNQPVKRRKASHRNENREKSYILNHPSGFIVAELNGLAMKFNPKILQNDNHPDWVRSYHEPACFRNDLENCDQSQAELMIAVIKATKYLEHMRSRQNDPAIRRYIPFDEMLNTDHLQGANATQIISHFKVSKDERTNQLDLHQQNRSGTFSQAHIRFYIAAYDANDCLVAETLSPPIRNKKAFEQLSITRIIQPDFDLRANKKVCVYCGFNPRRFTPENELCPFEFQLVFTEIENVNIHENKNRFDNPDLTVDAFFVPSCPFLLEFTMPNEPRYNGHQVFMRLRHKTSYDYKASPIKPETGEHWIYHADECATSDFAVSRQLENPSVNHSDAINGISILTTEIPETEHIGNTEVYQYEYLDDLDCDRPLLTPDYCMHGLDLCKNLEDYIPDDD